MTMLFKNIIVLLTQKVVGLLFDSTQINWLLWLCWHQGSCRVPPGGQTM